jgi:hypothetical protein
MIQAHKDVLDYLGIEHAFLTGARNEFCTFLEISTEGRWVIAVGGQWEDGTAVLNLKYRGAYLEWPVVINTKDTFSWYMKIEGGEWKRSPVFEGIQALEKDESLWNKRKETRFAVGAGLSGVLGLRKAEQKVILAEREQPCMVNDVSFRGIKLTTFDTGELKRGDQAAVLLDFTAPIERIVLKGTIQRIVIKTGERGGRPVRFAVISLRFEDPPLAFRRRMGAFIGVTETGGKG